MATSPSLLFLYIIFLVLLLAGRHHYLIYYRLSDLIIKIHSSRMTKYRVTQENKRFDTNSRPINIFLTIIAARCDLWSFSISEHYLQGIQEVLTNEASSQLENKSILTYRCMLVLD